MVINLTHIRYIRPKKDFRGFAKGEVYKLNRAKYGGYYVQSRGGTKHHEQFIRTHIELGNFDVGIYATQAKDGAREDHKSGLAQG